MTDVHGRLEVLLLAVLFYGTCWGALEASFGGLLHIVLPATYQGRIMVAFAAALMTFAARKTGKPWIPMGMALIAAPLKLFSAVIYSLPVTAPTILNPAFSILAQGASFATIMLIFQQNVMKTSLRFFLIGAAAGGVQSLFFVGLVRGPGLLIYPPLTTLQEIGTKFPHWVLSLQGIGSFLTTSIPYSALFAGIGAMAMVWVARSRNITARRSFMLPGTALCLAIFFLSSWLI